MSNIDYSVVDIPEDKPPGEYHYTERRAEMLDLMMQAGHPDLISTTRLAKRYGVSKGQISQDKNRLRDHINERMDESRVDAITATVFETAIKNLMDGEEYRKAAQTVSDWHEWLADRGHVSTEPERVEHDHDHTHDLTDRERTHLDAITGGAAEIDVEAVDDASIDNA